MSSSSATERPGAQTSFRAELYAVLMLLLKWPVEQPLHVVADNTAVLRVAQNAQNWSEKRWWKTVDYVYLLQRILRRLSERRNNSVVACRQPLWLGAASVDRSLPKGPTEA